MPRSLGMRVHPCVHRMESSLSLPPGRGTPTKSQEQRHENRYVITFFRLSRLRVVTYGGSSSPSLWLSGCAPSLTTIKSS